MSPIVKDLSKTMNFVHECRIRDLYAEQLNSLRPNDELIKREVGYVTSAVRADMRSINKLDVLNEWEFKIYADYVALGQILTYVALARQEKNFQPVRGIIAAFSFSPELPRTIEVMNLGIELVLIPAWMRGAGSVPLDVKTSDHSANRAVEIPQARNHSVMEENR